jgi:hypothetical protein
MHSLERLYELADREIIEEHSTMAGFEREEIRE